MIVKSIDIVDHIKDFMKKLKSALLVTLSLFMAITIIIPVTAKATQSSSDTKDVELKIASFNIAAKGKAINAIADFINEERIDVAGFQEVDKNTGRNPNDMLKEIGEALSYDYYFHKNIDYSGGEYGIGMIAESDLINRNGADLDAGGYEGRGWQRAEITIEGKTVAIYNTHLTWESYDVRAKQMRDVFDEMEADTTTYKVLTGDFNAQESNDEFDLFLRNYLITNGYNGQWLDTYIPEDASMKTNAIDNIITTRNIEIKDVEALEAKEVGSDHKALIATCVLLDEEKSSTQLLEKQIKKANDLLQMEDVYTEDSLLALSVAVKKAELAKTGTQDEINDAVYALNSVMSDLKRNPVKRSEPVAWWNFDGDEPLKDKTNRGNDGVEKNTVNYVTGLNNLGNALSTKDGFVSVEKTTEDLNLGTQDYSVGFWYKASNPGAWAAVLGDKNWSSGANPGVAIVQGQGQFYTTYAANGHGQQENIVSGTAKNVYDGKWHYVAAVLDRDKTSTLYVDGKQIASTSIASSAEMDATVTNPFNIGADGNGQYRIDSLIDDVKVYRNVLSSDEILEEYLLNCDTSQLEQSKLIEKTENYLKDLTIDPNDVRELATFESEDGKLISKIFCSENDTTIDDKGNVLRQPIVDKRVQVSYIIQRNEEGIAYDDGTIIKNKWITVKGKGQSGKNEKPEVVPSLQEWSGADKGSFALTTNSRIVVSNDDMDVLGKAAEITQSDIKEMFGLDVNIVSESPKAGDLVLTFENGDQALGEQGYALEINDYITIRGTAYRGVFFGTRSVLQGMLTSGNNTIACGTAIDYPNYAVRKFMLDIGRKYFPMWYLEDVIKYASWMKLTDFQSHISEDTFNDYSAFRLESDIPNLTSKDGYYTKDEYRNFQKQAADYGIRVITEIDGPAHARRFIELGEYEDAPEKYKNLGLDGTHFNLSEEGGARERVLNLMDEVLEEYLGGDDPVITTDAFNIGMDEYFGNKDDLRAYATHMYDQVVNKYHKTAFAWDSDASLANENYPKENYPMDDIVIDFWKWEEVSGGMKKLMDQGYNVVNGDHRWYIVPGAQIGFYDYANEEKLYNELSAGNMVGWYGNGTIFPEGHPNIVGGNMLLWNDRGMFAGYTVNDIFARQRSQYPYLAQSYWYGREDETFKEFKDKVDTVEVGPGLNNLYKDIDSKDEIVYNFDMEQLNGTKIKDTSDNGYDATLTNGKLTNGPDGKQLTLNGNGYIEATHKALKWPYTAMFDITIDPKQTGDIILFEEEMPIQGCVEKDGIARGHEKRVILLKEQNDGTYHLQYSRENFSFEHNMTFKKGQPYRIAFTSDESKPTGGEYAKWNQPSLLYVNGELVSTLQGPSKPDGFQGQWWVDSPSMNMPLEKIGQKLVGSLDNFQLYNRVLTNEEIKNLGGFDESGTDPEEKNIALHKPTTASSKKTDTQVANFATDGNKDTRWGSNYNSSTNDPFDKIEWLMIDLEKSYTLENIKLTWQDAYAKEYSVQVSDDGINFQDIVKVNDGDGKEDQLDLMGAKGRYVRIHCTKAVPSNDGWKWNYGYSLYEVEINEGLKEDTSVMRNILHTELLKSNSAIASDAFKTLAKPVQAMIKLANEAATTVYEDKNASNEALFSAWLDLANALHYMDFQADKNALQILIDEYEGFDLSSYTVESAHNFTTAYENADAVLLDDNALQARIDEAYNALTSAINSLVKKDVVDTSILQILVTGITERIGDGEQYKKDSNWDNFQAALLNAQAILDDENAVQSDVNQAIKELTSTYENIRLLPSEEQLALLNNFIKDMNLVKRNLFSETELHFLDTIFEKANAMLADFDSKQFVTLENEIATSYEIIRNKQDVPNNSNDAPSNPSEEPSDLNGNAQDNLTSEKSPATSDTTMLWPIVILLLLSGFGMYGLLNKRKHDMQ